METYNSSTIEAHQNSSKPSVDASSKLDLSHINGQVGVSPLGKHTWNSIYDPSSFKPPKLRAIAPGMIINPVIAGYVFGKGVFGKGYYSLKCRESFDVLLDRIDIMIKVAKDDKRRISKLMIIGCLWPFLPCHYAHYKKKISKLEEVKELAKLRRNASGPDANIELSNTLQKSLNKNIQNRKKYNDCGYYDDSAYYTDAISCGASADGGFYTDRGKFHAGGWKNMREGVDFVETFYHCLWDGRDGSGDKGDGGDEGDCNEGDCDGGDCGGGD